MFRNWGKKIIKMLKCSVTLSFCFLAVALVEWMQMTTKYSCNICNILACVFKLFLIVKKNKMNIFK